MGGFREVFARLSLQKYFRERFARAEKINFCVPRGPPPAAPPNRGPRGTQKLVGTILPSPSVRPSVEPFSPTIGIPINIHRNSRSAIVVCNSSRVSATAIWLSSDMCNRVDSHHYGANGNLRMATHINKKMFFCFCPGLLCKPARDVICRGLLCKPARALQVGVYYVSQLGRYKSGSTM